MDINYYITYDLPVPYKGLSLYPITMEDYMFMIACSQCFTFDKNSIPDPKVITMTNLEYMYYATIENITETPYIFWFDRILNMVLKDEESFRDAQESMSRYQQDEKGKPYFVINNETYTSKDYDEMKAIISQQNLIDLPDETMSKEVRDSLEKAQEYKNRISGNVPGTIEDYMVSLSLATGWELSHIRSMPVRKFIKSIRRMDALIHYKIYLQASMSGMVEFKDKSFIKHWLSGLEDKKKYEDVSLDVDSVQRKLSMESAKEGR